MTKTAQDYRVDAAASRKREQESWERSDTDGFLSQWASGISARLSDRKAAILEAGGKAQFLGLYQGDRRVKARMIETRFGCSWLLHDDETELRAKRGKPFLPTGKRSRVLRGLGLREAWEMAPAWATIMGSGTGLSGCASAYVGDFRTGCKWGCDAECKTEAA